MTIDTSGGGLRKRQRPYTNIPSSTIRDPDISAKALGVLLISLDKPEGWVFRADSIARERNRDGRDSIASGYKELAERGYYRVERRRMIDGTFKMGNAISEEPVEEWAREYAEYGGKPIPLVQQHDGTFRVQRKDGTLTLDGFDEEFPQVAPVTGFPEPGSPEPGDPGSGYPGSGATGSGNPGPLSTKENSLQKPTTEIPPGGDGSLRSPSPPGGSARKRAPRNEATAEPPTTPKTEALFDDPPSNDLDRTGGVPGPRQGGGQAAAKARRSGGRPQPKRVLADDWQPSELTWQRARKDCPLLSEERLRREVQRAIASSQARGAKYANHDRYWLNWVLGEQTKAEEAQKRMASGARDAVPPPGVYRNQDTWGTGPLLESWEDMNTRPVNDDGPPPSEEDIDAFIRRETEDLLAQDRAEQQRRRAWQ